jgi:hypothetical protein
VFHAIERARQVPVKFEPAIQARYLKKSRAFGTAIGDCEPMGVAAQPDPGGGKLPQARAVDQARVGQVQDERQTRGDCCSFHLPKVVDIACPYCLLKAASRDDARVEMTSHDSNSGTKNPTTRNDDRRREMCKEQLAGFELITSIGLPRPLGGQIIKSS